MIVSPRARITREDARPRRGGRTTKEMRRSALFLTAVACVLALFATPAFAWDDDDGPANVDAADYEGVTCGSTIKLQHSGTKARLHSHDIAYGSGSGQQSVTGFPETTDANSYWQVLHAHGAEPCRFGTEIANGAIVRLLHINTKKWLHSHLHKSPITGNQEVSAYGTRGDGDTPEDSNSDDNWKIELSAGETVWKKDKKMRLIHVSTGVILHSHDQKFGRPIAGQFEVCGAKSKNNNNLWFATEGVYIPKPKPSKHAHAFTIRKLPYDPRKDDDDGEELKNEAAKEDLKNEKKKKKVEL